MSKIVQAVNSIIANPAAIDTIIQGAQREIYFVYKKKYKWSVRRDRDGEIYLHYYPGDEPIDQLAHLEVYEWEDVDTVTYSSQEIGTREATSSFLELYTLLKERLFKVNEVLDDIISDDL